MATSTAGQPRVALADRAGRELDGPSAIPIGPQEYRVSLRVGVEAGATDAGADVVVEAVANAAPARAAGACSPP
jgi:hypothetical protein